MENWRLIIDPPQKGAWNMAVDEAILEAVAMKSESPTLRLYDWSPYTLSLGLAQPFSDVDLASIQKHGWDIVRRPTGGRAILHADELTYSICAPEDNPHVSGNIVESYRRLSTGLLKTLEITGIQADSKPKEESDKNQAKNPVCFQHPSDYEITYEGKKLIGSAQARRKKGVLQHGSLPLFGDIGRIVSVLQYPDEASRKKAREELLQRATTVTSILKKDISWMDMAQAMIQGFQATLDIQLVPGSLTGSEKDRADELLEEKYANDQWTKRL
jgi:lipoyl(octanoyl) transferase